MSSPPLERLRTMSKTLRRWVLEAAGSAGVGHIGSALSVVEIVAALWGGVLHAPGSREPGRDHFILSKGHAALTLYAALRWNGLLDEETFHSYCTDGTLLGVHPDSALPGIDFSTGSLGQGLSVGCGLAYGLRQQGSATRVAVLLSDAECNEGQVWEAAQFAAHHRLGQVLGVLDANGSQALGPTRTILDLGCLVTKWRAFGWDAVEVDGHDVGALWTVLAERTERPRMVVAHTVLGKGVSYMEQRHEWHYLPMDQAQFRQACAEVLA